jgi:hypothetical protein
MSALSVAFQGVGGELEAGVKAVYETVALREDGEGAMTSVPSRPRMCRVRVLDGIGWAW